MVSVDMSVFIQIINFLILIWVLNQLVYKPIRRIMAERGEKIAGLEGEIEISGSEAKEKEAAFDIGLKDARTKGLQEKQALIQTAQELEKEKIDEIHQKSQKELQNIRAQISNEVDAVRNALMKDIDILAKNIGDKILGRAI